jgi:hypothetical protein
MAARRNMLQGKQWLKRNEVVQNCAFGWFSFLKLILMHGDEQRKSYLLLVLSYKLSALVRRKMLKSWMYSQYKLPPPSSHFLWSSQEDTTSEHWHTKQQLSSSEWLQYTSQGVDAATRLIATQ